MRKRIAYKELKNWTKEEKLNFIKGLKAGTRHISELTPRITTFWKKKDENKYLNIDTGELLTAKQFEERHREPGVIHRTVLFVDYSGKSNINNSTQI